MDRRRAAVEPGFGEQVGNPEGDGDRGVEAAVEKPFLGVRCNDGGTALQGQTVVDGGEQHGSKEGDHRGTSR